MLGTDGAALPHGKLTHGMTLAFVSPTRGETPLQNSKIKFSKQGRSVVELKPTRRLSELFNLLENFPRGLSSEEISLAMNGKATPSARSDELMRARIAATRKLIQRARKFLADSTLDFELEYQAQKRVWRLNQRVPIRWVSGS